MGHFGISFIVLFSFGGHEAMPSGVQRSDTVPEIELNLAVHKASILIPLSYLSGSGVFFLRGDFHAEIQ